MVVYGDELHGAECPALPEGMSLLLETINSSPSFGISGRIRYARPTHSLEDPVRGIPEGDGRGASMTLIPGAVDEGRFRDDAASLSPVPTDQDILASGKRLGGRARTPPTPTETLSTLLHEGYGIPRPFVYNP